MIASSILVILAFALLLYVAASHARLTPLDERAPRPPDGRPLPSVSVIRPIRGLDAGERGNLRAALSLDYPGELETIFVLDGEDDPAMPFVREAIAGHERRGGRGSVRVLIAGAPPKTRTGKLNAMIAGLAAAKGELVAFADSDTRPPPDLLRELVYALLADPGAGSAFAPVVATAAPKTAADVGYALMLNGLYGPDAELTARESCDRLPFIMGQFMVLRREAIRRIGGLECAQGQLVDDMYLGLRITAAGMFNAVVRRRLPIIASGLSLRDFVGIFLRWIAFSRSGLPARAKATSWLRGVAFWVGLLAALVALAAGAWVAAALNALVPLGVAASVDVLHARLGGAPIPLRYRFVSFALVLCAPLVYLRLILKPEIVWRGRRYHLDANSRLLADLAEASSSGAHPSLDLRARPR